MKPAFTDTKERQTQKKKLQIFLMNIRGKKNLKRSFATQIQQNKWGLILEMQVCSTF